MCNVFVFDFMVYVIDPISRKQTFITNPKIKSYKIIVNTFEMIVVVIEFALLCD